MESAVQSDDKDELQKLIDAANAPGETAELNEAERFIVSCGIKAGTTPIQAIYIWYKYVAWAEKPIRQPLFFHQFRKIFPRQRIGIHRRYKLDPSSFDLSEENKFVINKKLRDIREKRKAEWKRKNRKEVV